MINDFEKLRKKLNESVVKNGLNSEKTKKISEKFNKLVNSLYESEKRYDKTNILYIKYEESIFHLTKITKEFAKFPSIEEWNKYAKEKYLLNLESLKYISGLNWHHLRSKIWSKI